MFRPRGRDRRRGGAASFFAGATLDMGFASSQYLGATPSSLTMTRASDGYADDGAGVWSVFSSNIPRITNKGLLVEEGRTNSAVRSDEFDNASWTKSSITVAANSLLSPFGAVDADTLTASGANGTCTQAVTTTAISWTFSVFLRRLTGTGNVDITMDGTTWVTQTITSTGWTRCSVTQTGVAGTSNPGIRIVTSGDAVYASCAQAEAGAFASSPIRTTTAAVPRSADAVSLTGTAFSSWYGAPSAATLFAEYVYPFASTSYVDAQLNALISDGTFNNRIGAFRAASGTVLEPRITSGGAAANPGTVGSHGGAGTYKSAVAVAVGAGQGIAALNGILGSTSSPAAMPTVDRITLGSNQALAQPSALYIRRVAFFPARLSNAELTAITL